MTRRAGMYIGCWRCPGCFICGLRSGQVSQCYAFVHLSHHGQLEESGAAADFSEGWPLESIGVRQPAERNLKFSPLPLEL